MSGAMPTFAHIPVEDELLIINYPKCPKCKRLIKVQDIKFCPFCGTKLKEDKVNGNKE